MNVLVVHTYGLQERIGENMTVNVEGLGKITASKEVLDALSSAFSHEVSYFTSCGYHDCFLKADARSDAIFKALYEVGYYGDKE